jgi:RNA polymerase sigma factor (sigma-70 family)
MINVDEALPSLEQRISDDVKLAKNGSIIAYERLIKACQNTVTSIALATVKDIDDSEEIAQQVFISIWKNLSDLKNSASFLPWVRQSARYAALNFLRDNKANARLDSDAADNFFAQLIAADNHPDADIIEQNQQLFLYSVIDKLAPDEREIVLLYYREEQSTENVAQLLGISKDNVRQKLSRARRVLKGKLLKHAEQCIYSSAPTIAFSALVASLLTPSAPVAAASLGLATSKGSSSLIAKVFVVIGGAIIGAFIAVLAVVWSSNKVIKRLSEEADKKQFTQYRNETIAWIIVWSLLITAAYQLTDGWIAPILSYLGFGAGLVYLTHRTASMLSRIEQSNKAKHTSWVFMTIGIIAGLSGMVIGLINSGRLVI